MRKYIGDKAFYKMVIVLVIPIIIQQGLTSVVNLIDNVMVGRLGTNSMSAVAIVNQLIFVFNLAIFGGMSGASIYGAQFYGVRDYDGIRYTLRFKMIVGLIVSAIAIFVFTVFKQQIISSFLYESESQIGDIGVTLEQAIRYLDIMVWGLVPFMISQAFYMTLKETGETFIPMVSSCIAILVNLVLNYILIFGHLGFKPMGVDGAALGTIIARFVEVFYVVFKTYRHRDRFLFIEKAFKSLYIPIDIAKKVAITGTPLLVNELSWSIGMALIAQSYAYRGLTVVAAHNIANTASQVFKILFFALGNAIAILVGQQLGAGEIEKAKDTDRKLIFFNVSMYVLIGAVLFVVAKYIPLIFKTEDEVRDLATKLLRIMALALPMMAFNHSAYFTMRSGGKTIITFLFDSVFTCLVCLPLSYVLSRFTQIDIVPLFFIVTFTDVIKVIIGFTLLKSGVWARNIIK